MEVDPLLVASSIVRVGKNRKSISAGSSSSSSPTEIPSKRVAELIGKGANENSSFAGPSHILFSVFSSGSVPMVSSGSVSSVSPAKLLENRRRCFLTDPWPDVDYIDRRKRAHGGKELSSASMSRTSGLISPWDGISKIERELVGCCETLDYNFCSHDNVKEGIDDDEIDIGGFTSSQLRSSSSSSKYSVGGVLAVEKETSFAAILSRSCNTMASRSLALAILERTLQQQQDEESCNKRSDGNNYGKNTRENSQHNTSCGNKRITRFKIFFAAGGLRILNQWLLDASSYETKTLENPSTISKNCPASLDISRRGRDNDNDTSVPTKLIRNVHATRPIAFSILLLLEHIPFEKKMVTNSKINKQIQKLGKKIVSIKEANKNGQAPQEDLAYWITRKVNTTDEALDEILEAVDAVKSSWREKAKTKGEKNHRKPFDAIQSKMKERIQDLIEFENGIFATKPEWYRPAVITVAVKKKKKSEKRKAQSELEIEKLNLQNKIKQVQSRGKQLREKLRQRNVDHSHDQSETARDSIYIFSNKKVAWKDGLDSQIVRNRKMLEEVFIFRKESPSSMDKMAT